MNNIINYINTAPAQAGGRIIFLLALALIIGCSLLAFISELTHKPSAKADYPVRSHNLTRSSRLWIILFSLIGALILFLPQNTTGTRPDKLMLTGISSGVALLFFLIYHFTAKSLKIKALHAPLALIAAGAAVIGAGFWFFPEFAASLTNFQGVRPGDNELIAGGIDPVKIAVFSHFLLNAIAISALIFMLANAKEKENKRKQPREYYFKASSFAGSWLLAAITLQIIPLGWLFYKSSGTISLFSTPTVYWFAGLLVSALSGWLLLLKIKIDGLVNHRATLIIAMLFILSLCLLHFSPLKAITSMTISQNPAATRIMAPETLPQPESQLQSGSSKPINNQ